MTSGIIMIIVALLLALLLVWLSLLVRPALAQKGKKNRRVIPSEEMLDYARQAAEREDYELAFDLCSQIFEQPQAYEIYPEALHFRIGLLTRLHRYDEALEDIQRLKQLEPENPDSLLTLIDVANDAPEDFVNEARNVIAGGNKHEPA